MKLITNITNIIFQIIKGRSIGSSGAYNSQKLEIIIQTIFSNITIIGLLLIIAVIIYKKKRKWLVNTLVLLTFIDLFIFSKGNLISVPLNIYNKPNIVANWLSNNLDNSRFISTSGNMPYTGLGVYWTHLRAREPFSPNKLTSEELNNFSRLSKKTQALPENQGIRFRVQDASGYAATVPQSYSKFWEEEPVSPNAVKISNFQDEKLDILGVKYIVTGYPNDYIKGLENEKYKPVAEFNEIKIYENLNSWPRSFLFENENIIPADLVSYKPSEVIIETNHNREATLVLTDNNYPGWIAQLDEKEIPIEPFKGTFRSVKVLPGKHEVKFSFKSKTLGLGVIISSVSIIMLLISYLWQKKLKLR